MKIFFDDSRTATEASPGSKDFSGFALEMLSVPKVGEMLLIEKVLLHPRFFNNEFFLSKPLEYVGNLVCAEVLFISHVVVKEGHHIMVGLTFESTNQAKR